MIWIYGPAGSGKSTQATILAEKYGWKWLSAGQILRDSGRFEEELRTGAMIDERVLVEILKQEMDRARDSGWEVIFDGQPGSEQQVEYLAEAGLLGRLDGIIVLRAPEVELLERLKQRGRADDSEAVWKRKIQYFEQKSGVFLGKLQGLGVRIVEVDGAGERELVTERMEAAVRELKGVR